MNEMDIMGGKIFFKPKLPLFYFKTQPISFFILWLFIHLGRFMAVSRGTYIQTGAHIRDFKVFDTNLAKLTHFCCQCKMFFQSTASTCCTVYSARVLLSHTQHKILVTAGTVPILCGIMSNIAVIIAMFATRQLNSSSLLLILVLSISDLLACAFWEPLSLIMFSVNHGNCLLEKTAAFTVSFQLHFSAYVFFLIILDRFVHLRYLTRYEKILSIQRRIGLVVFAFSFALLQGFLMSFKEISLVQQYGLCLIITIDVLAIVTAGTLLLKTRGVIKRQKRTMITTRTTDYMSRLLNLMMTALIVFYSPFILACILSIILKTRLGENVQSELYLSIFLAEKFTSFNTTVNAIMFMYLNKQVKEYITTSINQFVSYIIREKVARRFGSSRRRIVAHVPVDHI